MLLEVSHLTKSYPGAEGPVPVLRGVDMTLEAGETLALTGESGSGKSTLLHLVGGLDVADAGSIRLDGQEITTLDDRGRAALRRGTVGVIFQQFNLVPRLDVVSNVLHGTLNRRSTLATMFNLYPDRDIVRAIDILDRLGIAQHAPKRAEALSGGQQQRVAIARALMQDPTIILADEPIASLDPMNAQVVMQSLRKIHEEDGRMVIANLHTLDTARRYCDRVVGMRDGRIVFDGTPEQLTTGVARDIYGADATFSEAATSTEIETLDTARQMLADIASA